MSEFRAFLEHAFRHPLPGQSAQQRMAPVPDAGDDLRFAPPPPNTPKSAVLLLICPPEGAPSATRDSEITRDDTPIREPNWQDYQIILTLRSNRLPTHSGQLSLPGGRLDPGETIVAAALRECFEEVGIPTTKPVPVGELSPLFVPHSNNLIHPIVAWCDEFPTVHPCISEVDEILYMSIEELLSESKRTVASWHLRGQNYTVPFWQIHRVPLWGATAMILSEFEAIIRQYSPAQKQERSSLSLR